MKKRNANKNKKALLALSLACVSALSLCFLTACDGDDDSSTDKNSTTVTKTDNEKIANGNFEYYTETKDLSSVISPSGWTKSVGSDANGSSALSSTKASGIVDTEFTHWVDLTHASTAYTEGMPLKDVLAAWEDTFTIYDRLSFYKQVSDGKYKDEGVSTLKDFEYYSDYTYPIDLDDVPTCNNPGTHNGLVNVDQGDSADSQTSVLMIHNYRSDLYGTAQKYTSSTTVTVPANTSAELSVWVKTEDLTFDKGAKVTEERGAYIGVTHTLGGKTLDQMQIKNIVTEDNSENYGWEKYTVYLKGASYADSTFQVVLGLGQGSSVNRYENVEGYAFFDDVTYRLLTNEEFEELSYGLPVCYAYDDAEDKRFLSDEEEGNSFALDLYGEFEELSLSQDVNVSLGLTEDTSVSGKTYTTSGETSYKGLNIPTQNDVTMVGSLARLKSVQNEYLSSVLTKDFASFPFDEDDDIIMLLSANGASYTAKMTDGEEKAFTLAPGERKVVSFFAKTSALNGYTGAAITLFDGENTKSISAFDTTTLDPVSTETSDDLFNGWAQCFFFVENETEEEKTFSLNFTFGPTSIVGSTASSYLEGYAAFTNFEIRSLSETEYENISSSTRTVFASLTGKTETESSAFDRVIYNGEQTIETGFAIPLNYQGVTGGSYYVGGTSSEKANSLATAGLLNAKYAENYLSSDWAKALAGENTEDWFETLFGDSSQPLVIYNEEETSYGYIATSSSTISASSYAAISLDVTVSKGAVAYVYLIDASSLENGYRSPLKVTLPKVTFWYDDDGNILTKDPSSDDFNAKKDVAYYVNENGLYESATKDGLLYANLKAFTLASESNAKAYPAGTDAGNNLLRADGKIAFYYHDGAYYAEYNEKTSTYLLKVNDIPDSFAAEYARYYSPAEKELYSVIDNRNGSETIRERVTYYIATGNASKQYRLEVFSGNREGTEKSAAGSYVAFDSLSYSSLSSSYTSLLDETVNEIAEEENGVTLDKTSGRLVKDGKTYENALYYTFTFYDSSSFVRYDENADPTNNYIVYSSQEENPGNLYEAYLQSEQSEQMVYLKNGNTVFVNYNAINTSVSADTPDEEEEEESGFKWSSEFFMMIASIALSVVLVFTLVALFAKRVAKDKKKNKVVVEPQYRSKRDEK